MDEVINDIMLEDLLLEGGGILNPDLVREKDLTLERVQKIVELHAQKDEIMRRAHDAVKEIEFAMQRAWGFEENPSMHTHRFAIPYPRKQGA